jgi:non-ribosomal peptide synthetase component F
LFLTATATAQSEGLEPCCLHELFAAQVARCAGAEALSFEGGTWTYGELDRRSNRLAWRLVELGVGPEMPVAICAERSPELVLGMLAILKAGGAYLPLDPAYPHERLAFMLEDSRAPVLLVDRVGGEPLVDLLAASAVTKVALDAFAEEACGESCVPPAAGVGPGNLAYVIYTSGSTGRPKGVMTSHGAIVNALAWGRKWPPNSFRSVRLNLQRRICLLMPADKLE